MRLCARDGAVELIDARQAYASPVVIAVPKNATNPELAADLVKIIAGADGQAVSHKYNYVRRVSNPIGCEVRAVSHSRYRGLPHRTRAQ